MTIVPPSGKLEVLEQRLVQDGLGSIVGAASPIRRRADGSEVEQRPGDGQPQIVDMREEREQHQRRAREAEVL